MMGKIVRSSERFFAMSYVTLLIVAIFASIVTTIDASVPDREGNIQLIGLILGTLLSGSVMYAAVATYWRCWSFVVGNFVVPLAGKIRDISNNRLSKKSEAILSILFVFILFVIQWLLLRLLI